MFKIINIILLGFINCTNIFAQQKPFGYRIFGMDDIISDIHLIHKNFVLDSVCIASYPGGGIIRTYNCEYYDDGKLKSDYNFISFKFLDNTSPHPKLISIPGYRYYFYNERGDVDSISTRYFYNSQWHDSSSYRMDYIYDTNGKILSKTFFNNGELTKIEQNSYDLVDNLILNRVIDLVLQDTTDNIREYDEQNRLVIKKSIKRVDPDKYTQYVYKYDSTGNAHCTLIDIDEGEPYPVRKYDFEFDEFGKTINEVFLSSYNPDDSTWFSTLNIPFEYDDNGKILYMGGSYWCRYNADGNLDTLINTHPVESGYLGGRATLGDAYGNIIKLPDYYAVSTFFYSELITGIKLRNENELNFSLYQNYPNPFNPKTVISWQLTESNYVDLSIYNSLGQKICTLISEKQTAGSHQVEFDGAMLASGIYFYKLQSGKKAQIKKMLFIK